MSSLFDRVGKVVKAEWNSRFSEDDDDVTLSKEEQETVDAALRDTRAASRAQAAKTSRRQGVSEPQQALRVLELPDDATLDEVRAQYFALAKRYHPRTVNGTPDQAYAAQTVVDTLTDALEILETHMLPVPR